MWLLEKVFTRLFFLKALSSSGTDEVVVRVFLVL